ncbi:putative F-box domain-containing protein [Rosa chinensis]|uniref:Putative F-box domain-containing protein n=1 Tax=Rosa chinensis TaxID=74649 RepID=A0A2P6QPM7_ROSCH|nr:putative F-box domain-containing protein [Rosa chinensis]
MEVINATLVVCGCLVFGAVEIKRLLRSKPGEKLPDDIMDIVPWKKLPDDVIEMIVPHLSVRDRIRLSSVCKPWSSAPMRTDIPSAQHQLPWLIFPQSCHSYLSFFDLCEGKVGKLDLPEPVQGGWFQGSSKGWMIMITEKDLDSTMFLVNPISGAQHQLPHLSTTPSFQSFVDTTTWKRYGASAFCYSVRIKMGPQ